MSYNGFTNQETWNVALWIGNEESWYYKAKQYRNKEKPFICFRQMMRDSIDIDISRLPSPYRL